MVTSHFSFMIDKDVDHAVLNADELADAYSRSKIAETTKVSLAVGPSQLICAGSRRCWRHRAESSSHCR
jgi:hypothetical protein